MDILDSNLIALLRKDARQPVSSLAAALGASRATIRARIDKLVASGDILGFTIQVRGDAPDRRVRAVALIRVEGTRTDKVVTRLRGMPEVAGLHSTNGRWDLVADLATDTLEEFDALLGRLRAVDGVAATETSILLAARK